MKKIVFFFSLLSLFLFSCGKDIDDKLIDASQLPAPAVSFLNENFPNVEITQIKRENADYEVVLGNKANVIFSNQGIWKKVYSTETFPTNFLPDPIISYINLNYAAPGIIRAVGRVQQNFELSLFDVSHKLVFDERGEFLEQK